MEITDEKSVAHLWKSGRISSFRDDLGNEIEVIYTGRESTRPGCDFQDAVILVNTRKVIGDVEVHLTSDLWKKHGHHENPACNGVILHIVMWQKGELPVKLEDGTPLPTVILSRYITRQDLGQWSERIRRPRCPVVNRGARLRDVLLKMGLDRFKIRACRIAEALNFKDPEQILYKGICRALGYSRNVSPFEAMAERLPIGTVYHMAVGNLLRKKALLLGYAGFLPETATVPNVYASDFETARLIPEWKLMSELPGHLSAQEWCFSYVRPSNHPIRRLIYLAHLLQRHEKEGMVGTFLSVIRSAGPVFEARLLEEALVIPEVPSLLGTGRAREMIINHVLPFLFAYGVRIGDVELSSQCLHIYLRYNVLSDNELLRYMRSLLSLDTDGLNACMQQGLLHIYHAFCRTKDCSLCPVSKNRRPGLG